MMRRDVARWLRCLTAGALMALAGCATVNTEPFEQYHSAVREAQAGMEAVMSVSAEWSREEFVDNIANDPQARFVNLMIKPGDGYDWSQPAKPLYVNVQHARAALVQLNSSFSQYTSLLARLASRNLVSTAEFDYMAREINQHTTDAVRALNLAVPPQGVALLSVAASEAARLFIESRRQRYLQEAIEYNQSNVTHYAALCISLLHTMRGSIKASYTDRAAALHTTWDVNDRTRRRTATEAMLALNEQYAGAMRILQELEQAYQEMPAAHASLAEAIEHPRPSVEGMQSLYASAKRLQQLQRELARGAANTPPSRE